MSITENIETYKYLWTEAIKGDFDVNHLRSIKERYDRAVKMNATYRKLYDTYRAEYLNDLKVYRETMTDLLMKKSKDDIAVIVGIKDSAVIKRSTKADMIGMYIFSKSTDEIESDHSRVKRAWAAMSDQERIGDV